MSASITFDNSYGRLPERFYNRQPPTPVAQPRLVRLNRDLTVQLGIDPTWLGSEAGCQILSGNTVPDGADPLATVYAGHQFGSFNPQLGDGRALLLGEILTTADKRYDLQLKGSGPTPYSRGGDGRSPLGPVLREFLISEAMHALQIPTTRALAAVTTGESVYRPEELPGGVLTRVAASHIRVGTFQFFAAQRDTDALQRLTEYVINRHYPDARRAEHPVEALLRAVIARQASTVAAWQLIGFVHGVMNTDNMLLSGETVDYGPCAFMDTFADGAVFSSIDHGGRYAYRNQPGIARWNLTCFAQALLPVLASDQNQALALAQAAIDDFEDLFVTAYNDGARRKLGLTDRRDEDLTLFADFLGLLGREQDDFTLAFRRLADLAAPESNTTHVNELFEFSPAYADWLARWRHRCIEGPGTDLSRQRDMYVANPALIPRTHQVERVITAALDEHDLTPFHMLADALTTPRAYHQDHARYATPPQPEERVLQTFCGT